MAKFRAIVPLYKTITGKISHVVEAQSVSLFVTHMIASKGLQALAVFENVYYINKVGNYF